MSRARSSRTPTWSSCCTATSADPGREGEADVIVAKHRNGPTKDIVLAFQGHYSRFANMANDFG